MTLHVELVRDSQERAANSLNCSFPTMNDRIDRASKMIEKIILRSLDPRLTPKRRIALYNFFIAAPSEFYVQNRTRTAYTSRNQAYLMLENIPELSGLSRKEIHLALSWIRVRKFCDAVQNWVNCNGPEPLPFEFPNFSSPQKAAMRKLDRFLRVDTSNFSAGVLACSKVPNIGFAISLIVDGDLKAKYLIAFEKGGLLPYQSNALLGENTSPAEAFLRLLFCAPPIDLKLALSTRRVKSYETTARVRILPKRVCRASQHVFTVPWALRNTKMCLIVKSEDLLEKNPIFYIGAKGAEAPFLKAIIRPLKDHIVIDRKVLDGSPSDIARSAYNYRQFLNFSAESAKSISNEIYTLDVYETPRKPASLQKRLQFGSRHICIPSWFPHDHAQARAVVLKDESTALGVWEPGEIQKGADPFLIVKRGAKGWTRVWEDTIKIGSWYRSANKFYKQHLLSYTEPPIKR